MISNAKIRINLKDAKKNAEKRWQNLEKTGKYGYLRGFSINTAHGQSQLSRLFCNLVEKDSFDERILLVSVVLWGFFYL